MPVHQRVFNELFTRAAREAWIFVDPSMRLKLVFVTLAKGRPKKCVGSRLVLMCDPHKMFKRTRGNA